MAYQSKATLVTQLTAVQTAIAACLDAQSYTVGDAAVQKARLDLLMKREDDLLKKIEAADAAGDVGGCFTRIRFQEPA